VDHYSVELCLCRGRRLTQAVTVRYNGFDGKRMQDCAGAVLSLPPVGTAGLPQMFDRLGGRQRTALSIADRNDIPREVAESILSAI
jgi:hypothetical protein